MSNWGKLWIKKYNMTNIAENQNKDKNINKTFIHNTELYISVILSLFSLWIDTSLVAERLNP